MNILVTGSSGFIGKNLIAQLKEEFKDIKIFEYDINNTLDELKEFINEASFIYHLAGVNRPQSVEEFYKGNSDLTKLICDLVEETKRNIPIVVSSSIQATNNNDYGKSKKLAEDYLKDYQKKTGNSLSIYRFPNVFGKWCKPNYNSAVATFCYNIARDLSISVNDRSVIMNLLYIDDLVEELIRAIKDKRISNEIYHSVSTFYTITLGEIVDLLYSFKRSREERTIPNMSNELTMKLYSTYLSYLLEDRFSYELKMNKDNRGSFTEFLKTQDRGQVSINISKPGITKGNHWHSSKNEKFLVVSGKGVIRFRKITSNDIIEYFVSGDKMEVVDIPPGYTHNIENLGKQDMVTIMWVNECFDPKKPDTHYLEV